MFSRNMLEFFYRIYLIIKGDVRLKNTFFVLFQGSNDQNIVILANSVRSTLQVWLE